MIFVTVGSQKFQFDRLIKAVDALVSSREVESEAFAQTGSCAYIPKHMKHGAFLDREEFRACMDACDIVVTHGGTGAIIGAIKDSKKVIAVPRLARYGEHVDDHQTEIVSRFGEMGLIEPCMDPADLSIAYDRVLSKTYLPYESNTTRFVTDLAEYIDAVGGSR